MDERAEQAALGYFHAWIRATTEGDQWVKPKGRIIDGTNGGIHSVRIEVDGVVLAVIPDPAFQAMQKGRDLRINHPAQGDGLLRSEADE